MEIQSKRNEIVATSKHLDLGGFGHAEDVPTEDNWPEPPKFPWFGVEIRVHPALSDAALIDLMERAGKYEDDDPRAALEVKAFVREVIHPDDFDDFWKLGRAHGYDIAKFAEVAGLIIQEVVGDPTQESSDSSGGPSTTATRSVDGKYKRTVESLEAEGRPDLAEFYLMAQEHGVVS